MPEEDAPTMTGTPGERRVDIAVPHVADVAEDSDDTTTADARPPAPRSEPPPESEEEDRTVQQKVEPPPLTRKPPPPVPRPSEAPQAAKPAPAAGSRAPSSPPSSSSAPASPSPSSAVSASRAAPSTQPTSPPSTSPAPTVATPTSAPMSAAAAAAAAAVADDLTDDAEPIEDSITATAPRIDPALVDLPPSARGLPITIPGSVEIRTVEHDELLDETEVRTRPGHVSLEIPVALRGGGPVHGPSQPPPPPRPAAGRPPSSTPPIPLAYDADDADDDEGVTTQAPAPRIGSAPDLGAKLASKSLAPETAPQTGAPSTQPMKPPSTQPATDGAPGSRGAAVLAKPLVADAADEPPTRPGVEEADELATRPGVEGADPPTRPGVIDPPTSPATRAEPPAARGPSAPETSKRGSPGLYTSASEADDESVTTRAPAVEPYDGDSVTTQAPSFPQELIDAATKAAASASVIDDTTAGTTQKVKPPRAPAASSPADSEAESITTQAPGPLTNILRVIASESSPDAGGAAMAMLAADDEPPENRTAVMANAPLKRIISEISGASPLPPIRPTGGPLVHGPHGAAAPNLAPTSESGLRVAGSAGADERASLGVLGVASDGRISGVGRAAGVHAADASAGHASGELGFPSGPHAAQGSLHDVDLGKGPRYGLLVGVVALISVVVPVSLYMVLRQPAESVTPGVPSELASEVQKHDAPRQKAVRGKNGIMGAPSAAPSASASAAPSASASASSRAPSVGARSGFPGRR